MTVNLVDRIERAVKKRCAKPNQKSALLPEGMTVKAPVRDISGHRFGRLVAICIVGKHRSNSLIWLCKCDCGNTVERKSAGLNTAKVASCGCYLKEISRERFASQTPWNKGKRYLTKPEGSVYRNKKAWADAVKAVKGVICEACSWGKASCDVHHIIPRTNGGLNTIENGIVLCPNCHRIAHEHGLDALK